MALREGNILKKADIAIAVCLIAIAVLLFALFELTVYEGQAESVIIEVEGKRYAEYKISDPAFSETVEIFSEKGYNKLEISGGRVRMTEASCPDKNDVLVGEISKPNQTIVCLPNRVFVRLVGRDAADAVSY